MENILINRYMRLLEPLTIDLKLELLARLSANLKKELGSKMSSTINKEKLLDELFGAWKDVDENFMEDIIASRNVSNKSINLDE